MLRFILEMTGFLVTIAGCIIIVRPLFRYLDGKAKTYRISLPGWIVAGIGTLLLCLARHPAPIGTWAISFCGVLALKEKQKRDKQDQIHEGEFGAMYENTYTPKLVKAVQLSGTTYSVCPVCGCVAIDTMLHCRNCSQALVFAEEDLSKSYADIISEYAAKLPPNRTSNGLEELAKIYEGVYAIATQPTDFRWNGSEYVTYCKPFPSPTVLALAASQYIHSFIVNEQMHAEDGSPLRVWRHSLPVKCREAHYLDPENWALPEEVIMKIQVMLRELEARMIVILNAKQTFGAETKERFGLLNFLPPWIVFPLYHANTLGWRMGYGEEYLQEYLEFLTTLSEPEMVEYKAAYPLPNYLEAWAPPRN